MLTRPRDMPPSFNSSLVLLKADAANGAHRVHSVGFNSSLVLLKAEPRCDTVAAAHIVSIPAWFY